MDFTNQLIQEFNNYAQHNALIFDELTYLWMLDFTFNETPFLSEIELDADLKTKMLKDAESALGLNFTKAKELVLNEEKFLSDKKQIKKSIEKLSNYSSRLAVSITNDLIEEIKQVLPNIEENVLLLSSRAEQLSNEDADQLKVLKDKLSDFKNKFEELTESFVSDLTYYSNSKRQHDRNTLWTSKYSLYTNNLSFEKDFDSDDSTLSFKDVATCSDLKHNEIFIKNQKVFTPLIMNNDIYISRDGRSISLVDESFNELSTFNLDDDIISSGALMNVNKNIYIICPCYGSIKIVDKKDNSVISLDYKKPTDTNIYIRSITVFNNVCYIAFNDYVKNESFIVRIRFEFFSKKFKLTRGSQNFKYTIQSDLIYDFDNDDKSSLSYFNSNDELVKTDPLSGILIENVKADYTPWNPNFRLKAGPARVYCPVVYSNRKLYYIALDRNNNSFLVEYSFVENNFADYKLTTGAWKPNNTDKLPVIANIMVVEESNKTIVHVGYSNNHKIQTFRIPANKNYKWQSENSPETIPHRNTTFLAFSNENDKIISLDTENNKNIAIMAVYKNHIIGYTTNPSDNDSYIIVKS